jgi:hypothetical protein
MVAQIPSPNTRQEPSAGTQVKEPKQQGPAAFQIVKTHRAERFLKLLVYGDYGVGKTTLCASAQDVPGMANALIIDAEAGDLSLSSRNDVDSIRITKFDTIARIYEFLRLHVRFRDEGNEGELIRLETRLRGAPVQKATIYRTIIVDSLSEVQKFAMYKSLGSDIGTVKLDDDASKPEYGDWNTQLELIRRLVRAFRDLPMNVIFVASEKVAEDDRKRMIRRPNFTGSIEREIPGFFDVVGYLMAAPGAEGTIARRLYISPGQQFLAKNRFNRPDIQFLENPKMSDLYKLCMEDK